jgi:hypothetical protein
LGTRVCILLVLSIFSANALSSAIALAQSQPAITTTPLPSDADLDGLLSARNWTELGAVLSRRVTPDDFRRKWNWLNARLEVGGMFLPHIYARDLWLIGDAAKLSDPAKDTRVTAGMLALYVYELIAIDGAKCEDVSAPASQMTRLLTG